MVRSYGIYNTILITILYPYGRKHQDLVGFTCTFVWDGSIYLVYIWWEVWRHTTRGSATRIISECPRGDPSCVCVFHIKPFFVLVDIQHTQCPRWFFILERCKLGCHKTTIQTATLYQYQVDSSRTTPCHCAGLWQAQHTYASNPDTLKERKKKDRTKKKNEKSGKNKIKNKIN